MLDEILKNLKPKMEKVSDQLKEEFQTLHTGKASAVLVEGLLIDYYGSKQPLKQMAQITTPSANQIVIIPFDKSAAKDIETSIRNSDLNLNPIGESGQIRLVLPPLSEERRKELTKVIHNKAEQSKVVIRNLRRDVWDEIQKLEKAGKITQDDKYDGQDKLKKMIEDYNGEIDQLAQEKDSEIMKV